MATVARCGGRGLEGEASSMKTFGGVAVVAIAVVLLSGCGLIPVQSETSERIRTTSVLEDAAEYCEVAGDVLRDDGRSMMLDTMGEDDDAGDGIEVVACVLTELDTPDYVIDHIDSTRALDGQQTDEWDDIEARWTYHPDVGMKLTLIDRS